MIAYCGNTSTLDEELGEKRVGKTTWREMQYAAEAGKSAGEILKTLVKCDPRCHAYGLLVEGRPLLEDEFQYVMGKSDGCEFYEVFLEKNHAVPYCELARAISVMARIRKGGGDSVPTRQDSQ